MKRNTVCSLALFLILAAGPQAGAENIVQNDLQGFSGQVRGRISHRGRGSFRITVREVVRVWTGNKARRPELLRGRTIQVGPRREDHKTGTGAADGLHLSFIASLKSAEDLVIEIYNPRGNAFHILELTREQRDQAEAYARDEAKRRGRIAEERRPTEREKLVKELEKELTQLKGEGTELRNTAGELQAEVRRLKEEVSRLQEIIAETRR